MCVHTQVRAQPWECVCVCPQLGEDTTLGVCGLGTLCV